MQPVELEMHESRGRGDCHQCAPWKADRTWRCPDRTRHMSRRQWKAARTPALPN